MRVGLWDEAHTEEERNRLNIDMKEIEKVAADLFDKIRSRFETSVLAMREPKPLPILNRQGFSTLTLK